VIEYSLVAHFSRQNAGNQVEAVL